MSNLIFFCNELIVEYPFTPVTFSLQTHDDVAEFCRDKAKLDKVQDFFKRTIQKDESHLISYMVGKIMDPTLSQVHYNVIFCHGFQ